jgi:hypothetical protein
VELLLISFNIVSGEHLFLNTGFVVVMVVLFTEALEVSLGKNIVNFVKKFWCPI